jgi:nickel-type superoxide dismutase maturation protease
VKFPFFRLQVEGNSMLPTLKPKQQVVTFNWFYHPKEGDLVVVKKQKLLVKRIKDVKRKKVFIVGDNPKESTDSRQFGWIDTDQILGKVIYIYPI